MTSKNWMNKRGFSIRGRLRKMMKCICSGEQLRVDEIIPSSESLATRDYLQVDTLLELVTMKGSPIQATLRKQSHLSGKVVF
ncbi:hypothetical protein CK203_050160 [Vitis vinifera]|uniref:Uncharacterized protein n=1 Tax=Vitis vinifera TaxID=29760 RepID=A0A438GYI6_VITVI|nr:hypothetical protein CK203_050160 [Vitis vinifera]